MILKPKQDYVIEAREVTVDNLEDVADWCRGNVKGTKLPPEKRVIELYNADSQEVIAMMGEYIVKSSFGGFFVTDKGWLEKNFDVVKE